MPVTRIIIIFGQSATPIAGFVFLGILALGGLAFVTFLGDGDGVPGAVNVIAQRAACFPTINHHKAAGDEASSIDNANRYRNVQYTQADRDALLKKWGGVWLKIGTSVKVLKMERPKSDLALPYWSTVRFVEILDESKRSCIVGNFALEMEFFEWIKWKLGWGFYSGRQANEASATATPSAEAQRADQAAEHRKASMANIDGDWYGMGVRLKVVGGNAKDELKVKAWLSTDKEPSTFIEVFPRQLGNVRQYADKTNSFVIEVKATDFVDAQFELWEGGDIYLERFWRNQDPLNTHPLPGVGVPTGVASLEKK